MSNWANGMRRENDRLRAQRDGALRERDEARAERDRYRVALERIADLAGVPDRIAAGQIARVALEGKDK